MYRTVWCRFAQVSKALTLQLGSTWTACVTSPNTCSSFLFSFFAVSLGTVLIHKILTAAFILSIASTLPVSSSSLGHPHICLCCLLCCCPGLSETHMDFPVLPFQALVCSPAHPALEPGTPCHSFPSVSHPYAPTTAQKQTSVLCFHNPEPRVLQECVRPCSSLGLEQSSPQHSRADGWGGDTKGCICAAPCTRL